MWALCVHVREYKPMTEYELSALILGVSENFTPIVQFWVSISFAVVVATFITSNRFNLNIIRLMAFLYILSSMYLAGIYISEAFKVSYYFQQLQSGGFETNHLRNPASLTSLALCALLFIGGLAGTLYFMYSSAKNSRESDDLT